METPITVYNKETNKNYTEEELAQKLIETYNATVENQKYYSMHFFGFKYGNALKNKDLSFIIKQANKVLGKDKISDNYTREITKGIKVYEFVESGEYGVSFTGSKIKEDKSKTDYNSKESDINYQVIYYGAPGTGKSHKVNEITKSLVKDKNSIKRTTFHPDSDYASFVGTYKPVMQDGKISYKFVKQVFIKAYVDAWKKFDDAGSDNIPEKEFLIIEEINRGNCAQIFGDLFQLLDRDDNGFSQYPIDADDDVRMFLEEEFENCNNIPEEIKKGEKLQLPNNLYIWATMNTSDQSLFPIDSAFKRRWDWKYVPIVNMKENYYIAVNDNKYDWWTFIDKINNLIGKMTNSEDKKLGYYFVKLTDGETEIPVDKFVNKVIFYLWNDVFKDYDFDDEAFKDEESGLLTFDKFFDDGNTVNEDTLNLFFDKLKLEPLELEDKENEDDEEDYDEDKPKRLVVKFNGKQIYGKSSMDVFANTIKAIGVDKVVKLELKISSYNLLSNKKLDKHTPGGYGIGQRFIDGYWLNGKASNEMKIKFLEQIKDELELDLEASIETENNKNNLHGKSVFKINDIEISSLNAVPATVVKEFVRLNKDMTAQDVYEYWKPYKKYSSDSWLLDNKEEHAKRDGRAAEYIEEIKCGDGESVWVNKNGWMHNPQSRDTIQEFIDAVNAANIGIKIEER